MVIKTHIDVLQDEGCERGKNQDSYLVKEFEDINVYFVAVADGVGCFEQSELAAQYVTEGISEWVASKGEEYFKITAFNVIEKELYEKLLGMHRELLGFAEQKNMEYGTTLTLLFLIENSYIVLQVGDSRCYLLQEDVIKLITRDQTLAERKREKGEGTEAQDENILTQCIGRGTMDPKIYDGILAENCTFLLCSDGLSNTMSHLTIQAYLEPLKSPKVELKDVLESLVSKARANGEKDNITAILVNRVTHN